MKLTRLGFFLVIFSMVVACPAQEAFWALPVRDLKISDGSLPPPATEPAWQDSALAQQVEPYAVVEGGEAYFAGVEGSVEQQNGRTGAFQLCVRGPAGHAVAGKIYLPNPDYKGMQAAAFTIPADQG